MSDLTEIEAVAITLVKLAERVDTESTMVQSTLEKFLENLQKMTRGREMDGRLFDVMTDKLIELEARIVLLEARPRHGETLQ